MGPYVFTEGPFLTFPKQRQQDLVSVRLPVEDEVRGMKDEMREEEEDKIWTDTHGNESPDFTP